MAKGTKDNFTNVVSTAPFYWQYHQQHYTVREEIRRRRSTTATRLYPSNGAETRVRQHHGVQEGRRDKRGSTDPAKLIPILETMQWNMTKGPEHFRKEDHQGVNSCLVVEGIPMADRGADGFAFAKVLEEHNGPGVMAPLESLLLQDGNRIGPSRT